MTEAANAVQPAEKQCCRHLRTNGVRCANSAAVGQIFCYRHSRDRRNGHAATCAPAAIMVPALEDSHAVLDVITSIVRATLSGTMDHKISGRALYGLQLAGAELARLDTARHRRIVEARILQQPVPDEPPPVDTFTRVYDGEDLAPEAPWQAAPRTERDWSFSEFLYHSVYPGRENQPLPEEGYIDRKTGAGQAAETKKLNQQNILHETRGEGGGAPATGPAAGLPRPDAEPALEHDKAPGILPSLDAGCPPASVVTPADPAFAREGVSCLRQPPRCRIFSGEGRHETIWHPQHRHRRHRALSHPGAGSLAVYVPWLITGWTTTSNISGTPHALPPSLSTRPTLLSLRTLGAVCIAAGIPILLDCFACFALRGLGTPAPIAPPRHLVVTHLYRYTRNPMYLAVSLLVFGQALLFLNLGLLEYGLIVCAGFIAFVHFYEEPNLRRKFGNEYEEYCRQVPRWIPRLRPYSLSRTTGSN